MINKKLLHVHIQPKKKRRRITYIHFHILQCICVNTVIIRKEEPTIRGAHQRRWMKDSEMKKKNIKNKQNAIKKKKLIVSLCLYTHYGFLWLTSARFSLVYRNFAKKKKKKKGPRCCGSIGYREWKRRSRVRFKKSLFFFFFREWERKGPLRGILRAKVLFYTVYGGQASSFFFFTFIRV